MYLLKFIRLYFYREKLYFIQSKMGMEEIEHELNQLLISTESSNVMERKKSLEKMSAFLNQLGIANTSSVTEKNSEIQNDEFTTLWNKKISLALYKRLDDPSERCRETAAEIILKVINETNNLENIHLSSIFPVLRHRLATCKGEASIESSEEVRLLFLRIMNTILDKEIILNADNSKLYTYMEDVICILKITLTDKFGEIKSLSCEGVEKAANAFKKDFHMMGSTLISPILLCFSHQQKRTRISAIQAVGAVLLHSASDDFKQVASHLAQRLFDHVPQVRLKVSLTVGKLLLEWRYGAANCVYLLPLLLTSLEDEVKENREETLTLWKEVGKQWIENELLHDPRMKDRMDFADEPLNRHPNGFIRHNLGCRQYITRIVSKLIPALKNDIRDWLVETRLKASSLTYIVVSHLEDTAAITQHAETLLSLIQEGITDSEVKVVKTICRVAHVYGYFVPSKTWSPLIVQRLISQPSTCDLLILSNILKGTDPETFEECSKNIANVLQSDSVCLIVDDEYLEELLGCLKALLLLFDGKDPTIIQSQLFKSAISIISLASKEDLKDDGRKFIVDLQRSLDVSKEELFKKELEVLLTTISKECSNWGSSSRQVELFSTLLQESGSAIGYYPELVISIFDSVLSSGLSTETPNSQAEPELQLKMFIVLSRQLCKYEETLNSDNKFGKYVLNVLSDLILPALVWKSGRKASAVRTAAASSLWSIFESKCLHLPSLIENNCDVYSKLLSTLNGLLEDDSERTRTITCQIYEKFFSQIGTLVLPPILTKIWSILVKRLDDKSNEVRVACLHAFKSSYCCIVGNDGIPLSGIEGLDDLYSTILIHMDDNNELVRNASFETLAVIGKANSKHLSQLAEKSQMTHKHKHLCNKLSQLFSNM